jgi:selenocysteine lyase/cysteine desulfurase
MALDVELLRARFPTLARKTYFQSGGYGLLSIEGKAALEQYIADRIEYGAVWGDWAVRTERVRSKVARLLNATADEIALVSSASAGINAVASALDFGAGRDTVLVSNFDYPTSGQIWHAQETRGATVIHIPEDADRRIPVERFAETIDQRTRLVALSQVCYRTGARLDVAEIARIAHAAGALVLVDLFQSAGAEHVDVRGLDIDIAVGGMQKYLLGSSGLAYLFVKSELIESLTPSVSGWHAQAAPEEMDLFHNRPSPTARRFQQGTPAMPALYSAEAGLDVILELGAGEIERQVRGVSGRCMDMLAERSIAVATPRADEDRGAMIAIPSVDAAALVSRLDAADIVTSSRDGNLRVMFHAYTNDADIDRLIAALEANRDLLPGKAGS